MPSTSKTSHRDLLRKPGENDPIFIGAPAMHRLARSINTEDHENLEIVRFCNHFSTSHYNTHLLQHNSNLFRMPRWFDNYGNFSDIDDDDFFDRGGHQHGRSSYEAHGNGRSSGCHGLFRRWWMSGMMHGFDSASDSEPKYYCGRDRHAGQSGRAWRSVRPLSRNRPAHQDGDEGSSRNGGRSDRRLPNGMTTSVPVLL
jgi:hypothetical protein